MGKKYDLEALLQADREAHWGFFKEAGTTLSDLSSLVNHYFTERPWVTRLIPTPGSTMEVIFNRALQSVQ